jgi:hypothetical protein
MPMTKVGRSSAIEPAGLFIISPFLKTMLTDDATDGALP